MIAFFLVPLAVRGQPADREQERASLYKEGLAAADKGRWAEAVDRFRRVIAIRSAPKALFALGQAERMQGQPATAQRTYKLALADARQGGEHAVAEAAEQALREIDPQVPHLVLRLDSRAAREHASDASASLDGQPVALGELIAVDPGGHDVLVEAPHARVFSRRVDALAGPPSEVVVTLEPVEPQPPQPTQAAAPPPQPIEPAPREAPRPTPNSPSHLGPIAVGGVGLAVGVAGLVIRLLNQSDYDRAAGQCPHDNCPSLDVRTSGNDARQRMAIGTVLGAVGAGAVVGAGVWWVLLDARGGHVSATLGPRSGGLAATVTASF